MTKVANVILVHGAWVDASSWTRVIPLLNDAGIEPVAVQLPLSSFEADVATVQRALALIDGPVLLVGHSYGGMLITEAGSDPKVSGLVYVAAFAPAVGESTGALLASVPPTPVAAEFRPDSQGYLKLTSDGVNDSFAQDLSATEKKILFATQAPTAGETLGVAVSVAPWGEKPSWYLLASEDRTIDPELQRVMAAKIGAKTVSIASSHAIMLSHADEVASVIIEAAVAVASA